MVEIDQDRHAMMWHVTCLTSINSWQTWKWDQTLLHKPYTYQQIMIIDAIWLLKPTKYDSINWMYMDKVNSFWYSKNHRHKNNTHVSAYFVNSKCPPWLFAPGPLFYKLWTWACIPNLDKKLFLNRPHYCLKLHKNGGFFKLNYGCSSYKCTTRVYLKFFWPVHLYLYSFIPPPPNMHSIWISAVSSLVVFDFFLHTLHTSYLNLSNICIDSVWKKRTF